MADIVRTCDNQDGTLSDVSDGWSLLLAFADGTPTVTPRRL